MTDHEHLAELEETKRRMVAVNQTWECVGRPTYFDEGVWSDIIVRLQSRLGGDWQYEVLRARACMAKDKIFRAPFSGQLVDLNMRIDHVKKQIALKDKLAGALRP